MLPGVPNRSPPARGQPSDRPASRLCLQAVGTRLFRRSRACGMVPWTLAMPTSASVTSMSDRVLLPTGRCRMPCISALRFAVRPDREPVRQGLYRDRNPLSVSGWNGDAKVVGQGYGNARGPTAVLQRRLRHGESVPVRFQTTMLHGRPRRFKPVGHDRTCDYNRGQSNPN